MISKPDSAPSVPPVISRWAILVFLRWAIVGGLLAILVLIVKPDSFVSEVRILPGGNGDRSGSLGGGMAQMAAVAGLNLPGGQESTELAWQDIINSRLLKKEILFETYEFDTHLFRFYKIHHKQTLMEYLHVKNIDRGVRKVGNMITVQKDLKTKLITISVKTYSPDLSQQIARKIVKSLDRFAIEKLQTRGGAKAAFTAERVEESQISYNKVMDESRVFYEDHRNFATSIDPAVRLKAQELENLLKLRQQVLMTLVLSHEQALMQQKDDLPILNVLDPGDRPDEHSGPANSVLVVLCSILAGIIGITHLYRRQIWFKMISNGQ